jgi:hypothetical protein
MRRAIFDPEYLKNIDWRDKTVEVTETTEQSVVNKTVRVTEEVVIWRKGSDHIETIHGHSSKATVGSREGAGRNDQEVNETKGRKELECTPT